MSVITISRGSFSGGKTLAECLASDLGYRCVDREAIVERAAASGVSQEELLEALLKPPSFLERFKHKRYRYLTLFQAALAEEVKTGKVVYHGNAGHLLLRRASPVLRVRIIAPIEKRLTMLQERRKMDRDAALAYIEKVDRDRKNWTQYLYGVNWEDPALYDLVLNIERFTIEEACEIVAAAARQHGCFKFTEECQAQLEDLALGSRVRADLAINPPTSHLEFEVEAHKGIVSIRGKVTDPEELAEVKRVGSAVPGVKCLSLDDLALPARA